ncbi:hypothetical protein TWF730_011251 [Orbilia blumenaviensis]|uniref:F-box domain-containing protein n=1 Tax=Orbilia blumenaviensis TaxID=1796055 RepID=A0AAV9UNA1_9PEZI
MNPSILDRILLTGPSPISTSFISNLSPLDISNLLSLSKAFRTSLLDPQNHGWVFAHLSLNTKSSPFHRLPKQGPLKYPWKKTICGPEPRGQNTGNSLTLLQIEDFLDTLPPRLITTIRYLNLDGTKLYYAVPFYALYALGKLEALEELSLRWTQGAGIQAVGKTYARPTHQNPRLKKLSFYGMEASPDSLGNEALSWRLVDDLENIYETDVTRCTKYHERKRAHQLTPEELSGVIPVSTADRCQVICERRVWTCTACGKQESNVCLWEVIPGVCEICEEYYCDECVPLPERQIYDPYAPEDEQANGRYWAYVGILE